MIDKQEFNNNFQYFDAATIVDVIDLFAIQQPELIRLLEQHIAETNLVQIKFFAHKLRGPCLQFFDPVSSNHGEIMEEAANRKIIEVVDLLIPDYPDSLRDMRQEFDEIDLIQKKIAPRLSLKAFLSGFTDSFSAEKALKLEDLEKNKIADGMPLMFADLKASSSELLAELLAMKKELIS
ncbi:MAG: hypothetical protein NT040_17705 [Bacteroidetes bacterium]|nr:hypothetical protein [Bacteroidota bacterium]